MRLLALALLIPLMAHAQTAPTSPTTVDALRNNFRPLLLFAESPGDPALQAQLHMLKDSGPGLAERNVLVIAIPFRNPSPTDVNLTDAEANAARRRFHVPPTGFTAILLGKDGGEKLRCSKPIRFTKLRETIDAMPMRQSERTKP